MVLVSNFIALSKDKIEDMEKFTQFCPIPFWGHYFHVVTVANSMDGISSTLYQMKYMNMIFILNDTSKSNFGWVI